MTAPVGLQEVEEAEAPIVDTAVMAPRPVRRCACGAVRMGDAVRHGDDHCVPIVFAVEEATPYPAPEVTSRDPWDEVAEPPPGPVAKQAQGAVKAGWRVRVQRSRGCLPHATHGTPGAVKTMFAVIATKGGASAFAVHDGTKWTSVTTWGRGAPWFAGLASITDLAEYLAAGGMMPAAWYSAIRRREAGKDARGKVRDACNAGRHEGASLADGTWTCPECGNTWGVREAAWRKAKSTKTDTAR